jgi:hypothetical protein
MVGLQFTLKLNLNIFLLYSWDCSSKQYAVPVDWALSYTHHTRYINSTSLRIYHHIASLHHPWPLVSYIPICVSSTPVSRILPLPKPQNPPKIFALNKFDSRITKMRLQLVSAPDPLADWEGTASSHSPRMPLCIWGTVSDPRQCQFPIQTSKVLIKHWFQHLVIVRGRTSITVVRRKYSSFRKVLRF